MADYRKKSDIDLAYDALRKRLRVEANIVLNRVWDEAIAEATTRFNQEVAEGGLGELLFNQEEIRKLFLDAAMKELG